MRRVCQFFGIDSIEIIEMDNSGNYRMKLNHPGAIDTIPVTEEVANRFKDLVEMDQEQRQGVLTEKGEAYNPEVIE